MDPHQTTDRHQTDTERTLQAALEAQRVEGEARFRTFVEAVAEGLLLVSTDGTILMVNHRLEEMFGYSRDELVGQRMDILVPQRYRAAHASHRDGYFAEPRIRAMGAGRDLTGCRKDASEFPVEIGLSYVKTEHGLLAMGLVTDITERKRIVSEISRINSELVRSNTELGQFAYVASHDLQEPLRMITGYLQLLERRYHNKLDGEASEFIRYAVEGAVRMKRLIEDLLALSRAGTQAASFRPIESKALFDTACNNLAVAIGESGATVTAGELPRIVADSGLLAQVFQNLIGNAIKFRSPDHHPHVSVSAQPSSEKSGAEKGSSEKSSSEKSSSEKGQDGYVFAVSDDGIGIEPHHMERIFGIFERLHSSDIYEGSGVGLAITRRILERHGGRIWVESKPGEGSTFFFFIPAHTAQLDASRAATGKS